MQFSKNYTEVWFISDSPRVKRNIWVLATETAIAVAQRPVESALCLPITHSWAWCSQFLVRLAASEPQRSSYLHPYSAGVTGVHETMPSLLTWVLGFQLGSSCLGSHPPHQPLTNTFEENYSYVCVNCCWLWVHLVASHLGVRVCSFDFWCFVLGIHDIAVLLYLH